MRTAILAALGLAACATVARADDAATVPVGAASVDITPDYPIRLTGYGNRKAESEGVEQRLHAKALALGSDADGPVVLLTVDNCAVPGAMADEVAARLKAKAGLPRERLAVCSTHTHCAPCLSGIIPFIFGVEIPADQQARIDRYSRELTDRIEEVALAALAARKPGRIAWSRGSVDFAANRRVLKDGRWVGFGVTPDGPVDHELPLLRVTDASGSLLAVLVNYACHCTTLGGDFNKICGDWAGYAQEAIEREHPGVVALVAIGCGADANPEPRGELRHAKAQGEAVAKEVDRLLKISATPLPGKVQTRLHRIELPFDTLPSRERWAELAKQPGAVGLQARSVLARLERGEEPPKSVPYVVQTWCFGDDLGMVFLAGEVVVDYARRLKSELDGSRLWVNAYSNDVPCYIASRRILREGGYEADASMVYYGRPTRLAPEAEDLIVGTVREMLPAAFHRGDRGRK
jgi:hypothetical protein